MNNLNSSKNPEKNSPSLDANLYSAVVRSQDVFGKLLLPPSDESINESIKRLHEIGAFDSDEVLNAKP